MKWSYMVIWALLAGFILLPPLSGLASEHGGAGQSPPRAGRDIQKPVFPMIKDRTGKEVTPVCMPVYKPPWRGAPGGRIAGGSRGGAN